MVVYRTVSNSERRMELFIYFVGVILIVKDEITFGNYMFDFVSSAITFKNIYLKIKITTFKHCD